jgi:thiol-disulfide isomerase/thioredoxin
MRPLDVVRGSLENWSDAELGALSVGMHKAKDACEQAKPESYAGDDLYDLARLCSFGQDWNAANTAALDYVASGLEAHRAQAYALSINALVHLNGVDLATQTAQEMLRKLPYDAEVAYAVRYMKDALEQAGNPGALTLAVQEHAAIVQALGPGIPLKAAHGDVVIGVGALYESAMELAFLQRYAGDDSAAASTVADVEGGLQKNAPLSAEDRQRVDGVTTQYGLLGVHLPAIEVTRSLQSPTAKARINPDFGAATVLVLFPDWCVQCRKMMRTLTTFGAANGDVPIHAYGLMFPDASEFAGQPSHEENFKELQGTATLVVSPASARIFGALDYPLGIVTDKAGLIRYIGVIPGDAFNGDGYIEKVITRMAAKNAGTMKVE